MKIWILLSRFELGGLERVQANLAPVFVEAGLDVLMVAGQFFAGAEKMLPQGIATLEIAPQGKLAFIPALLKQLHHHRPNIVMTTSNDVACLILLFRTLFFPKMKVICTQHLSVSSPWHKGQGMQSVRHRLLLSLMQYFWPKSNGIIAVSAALADDLRVTLNLRSAIQIIHNPIVLPSFELQIQQTIDWPWPDRNVATLVFAGRLAKVKRLDILLNAFLKLTRTQDIRLLILGDGPERQYVHDFITQHRLSHISHLAGYQDNPLPWIKAADILVLPSDCEGFGNVLVEAMACGTQVIATDCPHGPAEILGHGQYGQLVPTNNATALADAIGRALSKNFHVPTEVLVRRASEFSLTKAAQAYIQAIHDATNKP